MSTKRTTIDRPRRLSFSAEALSLFAELNRVPMRERRSDAFRAGDRELHRALGLWGDRICAAFGVLDREPPRAAGYVHSPPTLEARQRIYAVREALLQAVAEETAKGAVNQSTL
jgi:hypothetical protein